MIDTVLDSAVGMNQTLQPPGNLLETHRMVLSPPSPSRARRSAPSNPLDVPAPIKRAKKAAVPSGAEIAAALLDRSQSPRPAVKLPVDASVGKSGAPCASKLSVCKTVCGSKTTLQLVGALNTLTLAQVRDEAFTAIGTRPPQLCLDLTGAENPDAAALDSLVTIASVARMMGVAFCVRASAPLLALLETSHLSRLIPLDEAGTLCSERAADGDAPSHVKWLPSASR